MIKDTWSDFFRFDRHCVFSFIKLNDKWENYSLINMSLMQPAFEKIDIFGDAFGCEKSRISTKYDMTRLNSSDTSFIFYLKIDDNKLSDVKYTTDQCRKSEYLSDKPKFDVIHLVKQGSMNVNGVLDIYIEACRCSDGVFKRLVVKQHLARTCRFNVVKAYAVLPKNDDQTLYDRLSIDINNTLHTLTINFNNETICIESIDPMISVGLLYNNPMSNSIECRRVVVGDDFDGFDISCAMMFDRSMQAKAINDIETVLDVKLNKIDSTAF